VGLFWLKAQPSASETIANGNYGKPPQGEYFLMPSRHVIPENQAREPRLICLGSIS
jgi:hypothetical protein